MSLSLSFLCHKYVVNVKKNTRFITMCSMRCSVIPNVVRIVLLNNINLLQNRGSCKWSICVYRRSNGHAIQCDCRITKQLVGSHSKLLTTLYIHFFSMIICLFNECNLNLWNESLQYIYTISSSYSERITT